MKIFKKTTGRRIHIYFCGVKIASWRNKNNEKSNSYTPPPRRHDACRPICQFGIGTRIMEPAYISGDTVIGCQTYIGHNANITKAVIGNYCSIGNYVVIGPGEHDMSLISTNAICYNPETCYSKLTEKPCEIGNDVWIGTHAIIRRGVRVGNGSVIGANAFVNRDVPDFAIVVGCPAKIIGYRFNRKQIEIISKSKWWNLDKEHAIDTIHKLEKQLGINHENC